MAEDPAGTHQLDDEPDDVEIAQADRIEVIFLSLVLAVFVGATITALVTWFMDRQRRKRATELPGPELSPPKPVTPARLGTPAAPGVERQRPLSRGPVTIPPLDASGSSGSKGSASPVAMK